MGELTTTESWLNMSIEAKDSLIADIEAHDRVEDLTPAHQAIIRLAEREVRFEDIEWIGKAWSESNQLRKPNGQFDGTIGAGGSGSGGAGGGALAPLSAEEREGVAEIQKFLDVSGSYPPNAPFKYSQDSLIREKGQAFAMFEGTYEGKRGTPHHCFENASKHVIQNNSRLDVMGGPSAKLTYVEGYVNVAGVPIHHAWAVNTRGQVIDPTIKPGPIRGYFGVPFTDAYVQSTALRTKYWGIISGQTNRDMFRQGPPDHAIAKVGE